MLKILLLLSVSIGGALSFLHPDCNLNKCDRVFPFEAFRNDGGFLIRAETLKETCPNLLEFIDCVSTEVDACAHTDFHELAASDDKELSSFGNIFLGMSQLVVDLCDEDTEIHKAYVENVECMRTIVERDENIECVKEGQSLIAAYETASSSVTNRDCLAGAYVFACVSGEIQKECGEVARRTLVDMVKRSKFIQSKVCSPEDISELKNEFKVYLQLEGERQSIFEQIIDLRRRRK